MWGGNASVGALLAEREQERLEALDVGSGTERTILRDRASQGLARLGHSPGILSLTRGQLKGPGEVGVVNGLPLEMLARLLGAARPAPPLSARRVDRQPTRIDHPE